ncbi:MAG: DNA-binding protein [Anaerolineaceae bacterium 4572_78]|nr:MAG: DNA-binding protein [Anaerolineaceae bacterium 4572_78]
MSTLTIAVPDNDLAKIKNKANRMGISVEELMKLSLKMLIVQPDNRFKQSLDYVLNKNTELYQRLA